MNGEDREYLHPVRWYEDGAVHLLEIVDPRTNSVVATIAREPRSGVTDPDERLSPWYDRKGRIMGIDILRAQTGEQVTTITLDSETREVQHYIQHCPLKVGRRFHHTIRQILGPEAR